MLLGSQLCVSAVFFRFLPDSYVWWRICVAGGVERMLDEVSRILPEIRSFIDRYMDIIFAVMVALYVFGVSLTVIDFIRYRRHRRSRAT
jgi:hypothetical protein